MDLGIRLDTQCDKCCKAEVIKTVKRLEISFHYNITLQEKALSHSYLRMYITNKPHGGLYTCILYPRQVCVLFSCLCVTQEFPSLFWSRWFQMVATHSISCCFTSKRINTSQSVCVVSEFYIDKWVKNPVPCRRDCYKRTADTSPLIPPASMDMGQGLPFIFRRTRSFQTWS